MSKNKKMSKNEDEVTRRELEIIHGVSKNEQKKGEPTIKSGIDETTLRDIEFQIEQVRNNPNLTDEEKKEKIRGLNIEKNKVLGLI